MSFFTKLEKLSEKYVEGFFRKRFADHIQPAEIAKILAREMRDNKNVSVSKIYVPNHYTVYLGEEDWKTIDSVRSSLSGELQDYLQKKARDKGYELVGEVSVVFSLDHELSLGTVTVESRFSETPDAGSAGLIAETGNQIDGEEKSFTIVAEKKSFFSESGVDSTHDTLTRLTRPTLKANSELVLKTGIGEGSRFALGTHGVIIGRRKGSEIHIDDANASRSHASVDYSEGDYYITDLGSTNGTFVNGVRVNRSKLEPGDLIKIGTTVLEYKVV